jgi:hypothetical protein
MHAMLGSLATSRPSVLGAELTEAQAALRVYLAAGGLVIAGIVLIWLTVWWWRGTRPEPSALAPLEVMSDKKWASANSQDRQRLIEDHRPDGAQPLRIAPKFLEPVDLSVLAKASATDFDDLRERPGSDDLSALDLTTAAPRPNTAEPDLAEPDLAEFVDVEPDLAEADLAELVDIEPDVVEPGTVSDRQTGLSSAAELAAAPAAEPEADESLDRSAESALAE